MIEDSARVKALYSVLTGQPYAQGSALLLERDALRASAMLLFRHLSPTDEQLGRLLLARFGGEPSAPLPGPGEPRSEERLPERRAAAPPASLAQDVPTLLAGDVVWRVEIDGVPVTAQLLYKAGTLPVTRGNRCRFQGQLYRVSKVYGAMLHLTSLERELSVLSPWEVVA